MMNFAHALGWTILAFGAVMAFGVGQVEKPQRTGAFACALIFLTLGEVLSRI